MPEQENNFPNAGQRKKCWDARDAYFECVESNGEDKCKELRTTFESSCSKTWVKYFYRRRDFEKYKKTIEYEGFKPVNENEKQ
ncbi:cytochrome c oxidase assembly factor 6 homolog [Anneissia japonica]|uniref:cytochrome c oxidase assembly factor 6 homolog n=1 Tax=Anneissia japonica TaxID=1529436 RepID=UPI0014258878|nr:cytochrome c oxidase assembly factor 6 homolog [Anneissia japonica]